jgi:hypothetical protein
VAAECVAPGPSWITFAKMRKLRQSGSNAPFRSRWRCRAVRHRHASEGAQVAFGLSVTVPQLVVPLAVFILAHGIVVWLVVHAASVRSRR